MFCTWDSWDTGTSRKSHSPHRNCLAVRFLQLPFSSFLPCVITYMKSWQTSIGDSELPLTSFQILVTDAEVVVQRIFDCTNGYLPGWHYRNTVFIQHTTSYHRSHFCIFVGGVWVCGEFVKKWFEIPFDNRIENYTKQFPWILIGFGNQVSKAL
ncbi:Bud25p [Saccharomyces cerevisiae YJM1332]|nr:Bud25p [Saccharomyces cerevisiae YJM1332]